MIKLEEQPFNCTHCGKAFMKEKTLFAHMCEPKRRFMQRDEKRVQTGFMAFNRFFQITQNAKKQKQYEDFCKSSYYNAFVKFGSFINNVNPIYPEKFIDFVIRSGVKLDHWCRDELYEQYLYEMLKVEPVEAAVQRSIKTMMDWADANNSVFTHYFIYASVNKIIQNVRDGRVSPWMILNTQGGQDVLRAMNQDQVDMIAPAIDFAFWANKIKKSKADTAVVKEVCSEAGIL
jgi:hypothetical protein